VVLVDACFLLLDTFSTSSRDFSSFWAASAIENARVIRDGRKLVE